MGELPNVAKTPQLERREDSTKKWSCDHIRFNCNPEQAEIIKKYLLATGLPLNNIKVVTLWSKAKFEEEKKKNEKNDFGTTTIHAAHNPYYGVLLLQNDFLNLAPQEIRSFFVHEVAHANSPNKKKNNEIYGSEKERNEIHRYVKKVTAQLLAAEEYLDIYHIDLTYRFKERFRIYNIKSWNRNRKSPGISRSELEEEVWAILVELRLNEPTALYSVQEALESKHAMKILRWKRPQLLLTPKGGREPQGVDKPLLQLMSPHVTSVEDLEKRSKKLK